MALPTTASLPTIDGAASTTQGPGPTGRWELRTRTRARELRTHEGSGAAHAHEGSGATHAHEGSGATHAQGLGSGRQTPNPAFSTQRKSPTPHPCSLGFAARPPAPLAFSQPPASVAVRRACKTFLTDTNMPGSLPGPGSVSGAVRTQGHLQGSPTGVSTDHSQGRAAPRVPQPQETE